MTPRQVEAALNGFPLRYVNDWDQWLAARIAARPELLGRILRRWLATRPYAMRRIRVEANHPAPFLDDLVRSAAAPVDVLGGLTVLTVASRSTQQEAALSELWSLFSGLTTTRSASCVGITKSILLLTDGKIGPAFDSTVRNRMGVKPPTTARAWIEILDGIGDDIAAFEAAYGPLRDAAPSRFAHLATGRLYDMALGPRTASRES